MKSINKKEVIILELNYGTYAEETKILKELGLKFSICSGSYKGTVSRSYAVIINSTLEFVLVFKLAESHSQESILLLRSDRSAVLLYMDGSEGHELGYFTGVSESIAITYDGWTLNQETKQYYICTGV